MTSWTKKGTLSLSATKSSPHSFGLYSPHSFRTFADGQMTRAGLDRKYIAAIIGHKSKLSAESYYLDWDEIEQQWYELCEPKMTWLIEKVEIVKEIKDVEARRALARLVRALSEAQISGEITDVSGMLEDSERFLEDKSGEQGRQESASSNSPG